MNEEKDVKEISNILELMKANQNFDVLQFEEVLSEMEHIIGKELDRSDEQRMEQDFADNVKKAILKTLDGKPNLEMIGIVEQIISQAGVEYRGFKTKYMNDAVGFFIEYLETGKKIKPKEDETVEEQIDNEMEEDE